MVWKVKSAYRDWKVIASRSIHLVKWQRLTFNFTMLSGKRGLIGDDAPPPPARKVRGFFFTRHSQSVSVPDCPAGSYKMWDGFSLLHFTGDAKAHGQDLGRLFLKRIRLIINCTTHTWLLQVLLEAVYKNSTRCHSCSVTWTTFAITPVVTTTHTGFRHQNPCPWWWPPFLERSWLDTFPGEYIYLNIKILIIIIILQYNWPNLT